jgi:ankyrin repeat protein
VSQLLEKGADIEARDQVQQLYQDMVYAFVNSSSGYWHGPLQTFVLILHIGTQFLLNEIVSQFGRSPLQIAAQNASQEIACLLLEKGADIDARDYVSVQCISFHGLVTRGIIATLTTYASTVLIL